MKVQLIAAVTSAMCASGVLAGEYQTVRISNVDKALAKYTATTNGMAKNKIQFVKHNLVWPDGETAALCVPKTGVRNQRLELPVEIKRAGRYSFWIRHWRSENMHTALEFLLRSPSTECVNYTLVDRIADMWTDKDAPERKFRSGKPGEGGLVTAERLGLLAGHIRETLADMAAQLHRGSIAADPYYRSQQENACLNCDFFAACHFSEGENGESSRFLRKLSDNQVWSLLEGGGDHGP